MNTGPTERESKLIAINTERAADRDGVDPHPTLTALELAREQAERDAADPFAFNAADLVKAQKTYRIAHDGASPTLLVCTRKTYEKILRAFQVVAMPKLFGLSIRVRDDVDAERGWIVE